MPEPLADIISLDDAVLVQAAQGGDAGAFERLVLKYQDRIYNLCMKMTGHAEDARDLTQETFLKAFDGLGRFEYRSLFYTWLFRIAANQCMSQRRKKRTDAARDSLVAGADGSETIAQGQQALRLRRMAAVVSAPPDRALEAQENRRAVLQALSALEDEQRLVVILRDVESLDYAAIGEIIQAPAGTVRSRLHRARLALRELLKPLL